MDPLQAHIPLSYLKRIVLRKLFPPYINLDLPDLKVKALKCFRIKLLQDKGV